MVNEKLILFGINSLIDPVGKPVKSIEELRNPDHFINIISEIETHEFTISCISIPALSDSIQNKFKFILEYLSKQSTSSITEWNVNELVQGNNVLLAKLSLLVAFAARYILSSDVRLIYDIQYRRLMALFDLHMIKTIQNNSYQLSVDVCFVDVCLKNYSNDSLNNDNHLSTLVRSFTLLPKQSETAAVAIPQANDLQKDLHKVQYELASFIECYDELMGKYRQLSERIFRQADYDTIKDERNKFREEVHRYEIENKRLEEEKENVLHLQTRLQQYQKENDEKDEKIVRLEKELRQSKQEYDEYRKKMINQNADILLLNNFSQKIENIKETEGMDDLKIAFGDLDLTIFK